MQSVAEGQRTLETGAMPPTLFSSIQAKLKVGQPDDKYEQEADRVAEQVMRMPEPPLQRREERDEQGALQTKGLSGETSRVSPNFESHAKSLMGGGQPLPQSIRNFFEPRFGYDFSEVHIHNDAQAAKSTKALNARAFTIGRDVYFGQDQYSPKTTRGKRLLAHELTHFVQNKHNGDYNIIRRSRYVAGGFSYDSDIQEAAAFESGGWDPSTPDFIHTAGSGYIAANSIRAFLSDIEREPDGSITSVSLIGHGLRSGFTFAGTRNAGNTDFPPNRSTDLSRSNLRRSGYLVNLEQGTSSLRAKFAPGATITFYACFCGNQDYLSAIANFFNATARGFSGRVWWCPNYDRDAPISRRFSQRGYTKYPHPCGQGGAAQQGTGHLTPDATCAPSATTP